MFSPRKIGLLLQKVNELEASALAAKQKNEHLLKKIDPRNFESARNLLHYLAFRTFDLRSFQNDLLGMAISSSSHSEGCILHHLQLIKHILNTILQKGTEEIECPTIDHLAGVKIAERNAADLFGKKAYKGQSRIMVTLATDAADNYKEVLDLVKSGMHIARINTAHDNEELWAKMIANIKKAEKATRKQVKIYMDIEGPKLRTGIIESVRDQAKAKKTPHILLHKGSLLQIIRVVKEGHGGDHPTISLTLPHVFDFVKEGESIWFDDGKLGGVIRSVTRDYMNVEIVNAPPEGFKLKPERGVNFPDTLLKLPAITKEDLAHLKFIAQNADMVGFSFVQTAADVRILQKHLKKLNRPDMGIILKIETKLAFDHLPAMLFAVMESPNCGLMIARGDLAIEIGFLRMAEVQEEILWLAEAAHMPVIWATQVLEQQVKKGIATRAEISDVVKSVRAESVMLNKGPFVLDAIKTIGNINKRMAAHQEKKWKILRSLHVAKSFFD